MGVDHQLEIVPLSMAFQLDMKINDTGQGKQCFIDGGHCELGPCAQEGPIGQAAPDVAHISHAVMLKDPASPRLAYGAYDGPGHIIGRQQNTADLPPRQPPFPPAAHQG